MAGGHGTRFWPLARRARPKQFLPLGESASFLQETVRRVLPLFGWDRVLVVSGSEHADEVARQLPELPVGQLLVEPEGRNTAACLALAAEWIEHHVGDAVMVAMPADHVVRDHTALRRCLRRAESVALREPALVVLGIPPTRPETGFGYIETGPAITASEATDEDPHWVRRFHEKPPLATAKRYLRSGRFLWNAGIFVWRVQVFRDALAQCAPIFLRRLAGVFAGPGDTASRIGRAYRALPSVPVDIAVLQQLPNLGSTDVRVAVVRATFDWFDAGSWEAMPELWGRDAAGNSVRGEVVEIDAKDCVVSAGERLVVLVGTRDLIVVDAGDAVLVCDREHAQAIRNVPAELRRRRLERFT